MNHTPVKVTEDKECDTLPYWLFIWLLKDAIPTADTRNRAIIILRQLVTWKPIPVDVRPRA